MKGKVTLFFCFIISILIEGKVFGQGETFTSNKVKVSGGVIQGIADRSTGLRCFKGIPYAQPPVGELRWKAPQPVEGWEGIKKADHFGPRAMQEPIFSDMRFRTDSMSEDCLYLNVWTPADSSSANLPVLVYFYGGGFIAGDGSEWRYDGSSIAQKGIVVVTVNYRLGIFGFFAYPGLTKESPHHASGNYGLLDQHAALEWVHKNIAAFGGNPNHITIGGESAGSISVSAQMASPLSKDLIVGAIGESGAMISPTLPPIPLSEAEKRGVDFAKSIGASSLKELRVIPAKELLKKSSRKGLSYFSATVDGYFLPASPEQIFKNGKQAQIPLLVGWNSTEMGYKAVMRNNFPSPDNYRKVIKTLYDENADSVLKAYPGSTVKEVLESATHLASDRFIVYSTWKWASLQRKTGDNPVYRYLFTQSRPTDKASFDADFFLPDNDGSKMPPPIRGAVHSAEIEYALGNLATNPVYEWTPDDYRVSITMESYFANFIKNGNPNGEALPLWTGNTKQQPVRVMNIGVKSQLKGENVKRKKQHKLLDRIFNR